MSKAAERLEGKGWELTFGFSDMVVKRDFNKRRPSQTDGHSCAWGGLNPFWQL